MEMKQTQEEIDKCLEYSEEKEKLKQILKELRIFHSKPKLLSYFDDDKKKGIFRNVYVVTVKRGDKKISFKYGDSIKNTEEGENLKIYDILTVCGSEYYCPSDFDEFCSEFGYSNDSIAALRTFKKLQKQSKKLQKIFSEEEARSLPR